MAAFYDSCGVFGLKLLKFLCTAMIVVLEALSTAETGASTLAQFALVLSLAVAIGPFLQFRPQIFSYALLSGLMLLMVRETYRGPSRWLLLAVPMLASWANLHGGFVIGVAVIAAYGMCRIGLGLWHAESTERGARILIIAVASAVATIITPYGLATWHAVAHSASSPAARQAILEWKPLTVAMVQQWQEAHATVIFYLALFGAAAALAALLIVTREMDDLPLVAIAAMLIAATFVSMRNLPLALIAVVPPLSHHLALWQKQRGSGVAAPDNTSTRLQQLIFGAIALILLAETGFFSNRLKTTIAYPEQAVMFMQRYSLHGRILNDVNWGGYLIWHEPQSLVFIDGRFETVYSLPLIVSYLRFYTAVRGWSEVLNGYPNDFVLIGTGVGAYHLMLAQKAWRMIYHDPDAALFIRANSRLAKGSSFPEINASRDNRDFP